MKATSRAPSLRFGLYAGVLLTVVFAYRAAAAVQSSGLPEIDYDTVRFERVVTAVRAGGAIRVDGRLDEPDWDRAEPAGNFTQWSPVHGAPAQEASEVYFLYDDSNLYIGFVSFDTRIDHMVVNEIREDFNFNDTDGVTILLDSLNDDRSAFIFGTNPAGAKRDMQITNDSSINGDWDGVWEVEVSVEPDRWVAEFVIPFKTLRFSPAEDEWGVNLSRRVLRLNEESLWTPVPIRSRVTRVSLAGRLNGLEGVSQGMNLKVKPYVTAGFTEARTLDPVGGRSTWDWDDSYDWGADLKYSLTPSLTLDATYNTDFAQVEADQQQVNLGRFNLFFPEKRDFFLENAGTFAFGSTGGNNNGGPVVPFFSRRIGLEGGRPIPILGGGRVSGQVGRYDVGFLGMRTEQREERIGPPTPADNFVVARVKRNLLANSWVGALVTSRDSTVDGDTNRVYGADARFQFLEQRLNLNGFLLASRTPGLEGDDQSRRFQFGWNDDEVDFNAGYLTIQPNFNPEVGFVRRPNMTEYTGDASWSPRVDGAAIRNYSFGVATDFIEGAASKEIETRVHSFDAAIQFQNNGNIRFGIEDNLERLPEPDRVGPIDSVPAGDYSFMRYSASASSDSSRKLSGSANAEWGGYYDGTLRSVGGSVGIKPNFRVNFELSYSRNVADTPYGDFTTDLVGGRLVYGFSPRAFFNAFIQYNSATNQVSSNLRFNWTHSPLSDLYIVYNDTRDTNRGELSERAIIVKFTNLFSF